jgi:diguanylate cyclase (GGDEF)-like protein
MLGWKTTTVHRDRGTVEVPLTSLGHDTTGQKARMMAKVTRRDNSPVRLFVTFAIIMLCAVVVLGLVLAASYRSEATRRGLAQGRSEAILMAETAVAPRLDGQRLGTELSAVETDDMNRLVTAAVHHGEVLRLRIRNLAGDVVYSDDGSGLGRTSETQDATEALEAAKGHVISQITHLNADPGDTGPLGASTVEVYLPINAGTPSRRVGVLEVYLPYTPISRDVDAGLRNLYLNLGLGLGFLYILLFGISYVVGRRLRRQVRINEYMSEHDTLTDLPNRVLFRRTVQEALMSGTRNGMTTMIAVIDLDRFKEINDTLGYENGDRLLQAFGSRLQAHLNNVDALARLGGDEFGVVLSNVTNPEAMLQEFRDVIEAEINIGNLPLSVESNIGYVMAPEHGTDVDDLLQLADVAMYTAKIQHLPVVRYDESQNHYNASNLALVAELRRAIDDNQLVLHYQPKILVRDGRVDAVEALVRWQHPSKGLLFPDSFIPLAEQTDLIDRLTTWVVQRALQDLSRFGPGCDELTVAVNVSARNLGRAGFARAVVEALELEGVAPQRLFIEVTETALMTDPERAASVLRELEQSGVRVSIDDFGTGQTSLGYLSTLPIHELKIDRSFITDMIEHSGHAAIVHSIVELGHNLGFSVVGEGVETREVLAELTSVGCDVAQGYFFTRPMPVEDLAPWIDHYVPMNDVQLT